MSKERRFARKDLATFSPEEARDPIEEARQQATQLEEQAAEMEALNEGLSTSEARLRGTLDSALDVIVTTDAQSVIPDRWELRSAYRHPARARVGAHAIGIQAVMKLPGTRSATHSRFALVALTPRVAA